jgi:signal peptidase
MTAGDGPPPEPGADEADDDAAGDEPAPDTGADTDTDAEPGPVPTPDAEPSSRPTGGLDVDAAGADPGSDANPEADGTEPDATPDASDDGTPPTPETDGDGARIDVATPTADGEAVGTSGARDVRDPLADASPLAKLRHADEGRWWVAREVLLNVGAVVAVGLLLFAVSGVWPPMVAVESGSMEPHMQRGDLIFVTDPSRFPPAAADGAGIVTREQAVPADYRTLGSFGSVIVYDNPGRVGPPVIHRVHFRVEEGENWYPRANQEYTLASGCAELRHCPAPHAGYITKGDANGAYDQANGISGPVRPEWVTGVARLRIPLFGWIRLLLSTVAPVVPTGPAGPVPAVAPALAGSTVVASPPPTGSPPAAPDGSTRPPPLGSDRESVGPPSTVAVPPSTVAADTPSSTGSAGVGADAVAGPRVAAGSTAGGRPVPDASVIVGPVAGPRPVA